MKTPLLSHQKNVFIARDGKVIGEFPVMQLPSLLETGHVFPADYCYDVTLAEWISVSQFVEKTKFFRGPQQIERPASEGKEHPHRKPPQTIQGEKRKRRFVVTSAGWVAFALAVAGLATAVVWIWMLSSKLDQRNTDLATMKDQMHSLKEQYERLSFSYREIGDPGVIRGSIINRNEDGVRNAMPGMKVQLYPRDVIEDHLKKRYSQLPKGTQDPDALVKFFLADMPTPITTTVTDASGRYQFKVPKQGEYVVYTSVTVPGQGSKVWFLSVNSADPLNTPVDITDSNYIRDYLPDLMVSEGR